MAGLTGIVNAAGKGVFTCDVSLAAIKPAAKGFAVCYFGNGDIRFQPRDCRGAFAVSIEKPGRRQRW